MKLLFLGLLYNNKDETEILSRSYTGLQSATNSYQWNLVKGLDQILSEPVQIYSSLPVGAYPKQYKKLILSTKKWSHAKTSQDLELGCVNLPILKQLHRYFAMKRKVKAWCKKHQNERPVILSYSLYLPYLKLLTKMKKIFRNLTVCIIVPDLPNAFGFQADDHSFKKIMKQYLEKLQYRYLNKADSYVFLTQAMAEKLRLQDKPYVVVEGICPPGQECNSSQDQSTATIIMYSGALIQRYGLDKLLQAFQEIKNPDYQLWICGVGEYQSEVEKASAMDPRIKFFGYVNQDVIHKLQRQSTILINPRSNDEEYTRYSFPSKTLEYLTSGRPVVCFKLDCIPSEYDDYLYYIKKNTVQGMKEAILEITSMSHKELSSFGENARGFVLRQKNGKLQAAKILSLLQKQTKNCKVLQINITCGYGSTGSLAVDLHNGLKSKGLQSSIAYSAFQSNLEDSFKIESTFENYLRRGLNKYIGRKYIHSAPGTLRLIKNIKRMKPDLIHLHNIQQNSVHFPMLMHFLKEYGVPIVYTLHDCWSFTGGCYYFTSYACNNYCYGCRECGMKKEQWDICNQTPANIYREKDLVLHSLKKLQLICVSQWLETCAKQSFMKDLPIKVIYNGINTEVFRPVISDKRRELGISDSEFVILGVANVWDERKRLSIFLRLAKCLETDYRIVLVGITNQSVPDNMITIPRLDDKNELVKLYCCADVYLNSSRDETFGLTTAEAMACGTPVIAYEATACHEIVTDTTGIVLHTDNEEELLTAIRTIKSNGKNTYLDACREHIQDNYTKERMIQNYLQVYEQMLKDSF